MLTANLISLFMEKRNASCFIILRWTSGEVSRLSTYVGEFDPRTQYQHAVVALWEGDSLSARLRWVRFPSTAPTLSL